MIAGSVVSDEPVVSIEVVGPASATNRVDAVIDTGFNGYLTLPLTSIVALQLPFRGHRQGRLADGSVVLLNLYEAGVLWHGRRKDVLILEATGSPLIGMSLLQGCRLTMDVVEGGALVIDELRTP